MKKAIIGRKLGMTQVFDEKGNVVPVTVLELGPCVVVQRKTIETDGYDSIQIGFDNLKPTKVNKPMTGHFKKAGAAPKRKLKEFRLEDCSSYNPGDIIKADIFSVGEKVDVSANGKGKGFAGTIKRYGNHLLKKSHGTGPVRRHAGSMSGASDPSRILKGKKMPGRMGGKKVTVQGLLIVSVDAEKNIVAIKGAVPGPKGGYVTIIDSVKTVRKEEK